MQVRKYDPVSGTVYVFTLIIMDRNDNMRFIEWIFEPVNFLLNKIVWG